MSLLIMVVGVPGIGKSTWAKELSDLYAIPVVNSDKVRKELYGKEEIQGDVKEVFDEVYHDVRLYLDSFDVCILDATNTSKWARTQALKRSGADEVWYVIMDNDIERAKKQNQMRERVCPDFVIDRMYHQLNKEWPSVGEKDSVRRKVDIKIFKHDSEELEEALEDYLG